MLVCSSNNKLCKHFDNVFQHLCLMIRILGDIEMSMNMLSLEKRTQILGMMVEGMSIRSISRLTGVSKNTLANTKS